MLSNIRKHNKCQQRFEDREKKQKRVEIKITCQPLICARDIYNSNITSKVTCFLVRNCRKRFPHQRGNVSASCDINVPSATQLYSFDWRNNVSHCCVDEEFSQVSSIFAPAAHQICRKKYSRDRTCTFISFLLLLLLYISKATSETCSGLLFNIKLKL